MQSLHPDLEKMLWQENYRYEQHRRHILVVGILILAACALLAAILIGQLAFFPMFMLPEHFSHTMRAVDTALRELTILREDFKGIPLIQGLIDRAVLHIKYNEFERAQRIVGDIAELMHAYFPEKETSVSIMDIYERLRMVTQVMNWYM